MAKKKYTLYLPVPLARKLDQVARDRHGAKSALERFADGTGGRQGWRVSAPPEGLVLDGRTARRHTERQDRPSPPV